MRHLFLSAAVFLFAQAAQAGTPGTEMSSANVRPVATDSTDIFSVLQTLARAEAALESRDYETARQGFESVLFHDSTQPRARAGLRRTLIALGQPADAFALIDAPDSADAVLIAVLLGQTETPRQALHTALQTHSDPRLWTLLGRLQDEAGEQASARQSYAMAGLAGARPGLADNNIGQSLLRAGEVEAALIAFTRATAADPSDLKFDNNRRNALVRLGRTGEAVAALPPDRAGRFLALAGDRAAQDGEPRLARHLYTASLRLSPRFDPQVAARLERLDE